MRIIRWIGLLTLALATAVAGMPAYAAPQTQEGTGQICVLAFSDTNGDGLQDSDETLLAGVNFVLSDDSGRRGTYTTDGSSEPYCFGNLTAAQYTVQARPPAKLKGEATTAGQSAVSLANGATLNMEYGFQPEVKPAESSGGSSPLGRIVLGLAGVAILGLAGFLAYNILQRARRS
jgi:hypothetical protein